MKSRCIFKAVPCGKSLPVRGAWIEIALPLLPAHPLPSLPVRGAWIEIFQIVEQNFLLFVAPRAGSVD